MTHVFFIIAALFLSPSIAAAQDDNQLLRQGIDLENTDRVEDAIRIYERLLDRNGRNTGVLFRLASAYQKVGRYDDAITLLKRRLAVSPGDVTALNRLSDVYFAAGNIAESDRQIERLLQISPNESAYLTVGQRYERLNQDAKATAIYLKGRTVLAHPALFARELAQIYERAENYPAAVREYARLASTKPQYSALTESRLERIAQDASEPAPLFDLLLSEVKASHRDSRKTRLFVTFSMAAGLARQALDELLVLPPDARIEGSLLRLGNRILNDGDPGDAVRAFEALSRRTQNKSIRSQATAGVARGLELLGRSVDALQTYTQVLTSPGSDAVRDEAAYRRGALLWRMNQPDSSVATLSSWVRTSGRSPWRVRTLDLLGDIHLAAGRDDEAAAAYGRNLTENRGKEAGIDATFKLARLYTMQKAYGRAQKALASVLNGGLATMVYNDAIELSDIIDTGLADDPRALDRFADGLLKESQGDRLGAADIYLSGAPGPLSDLIARRGLDILMTEERWSAAEKALRTMLGRKTALASWVSYSLGRVLEHQGRAAEAIAIYETVLADYPLTLEADRSRERLTDLRAGTNPSEAG